MTPSDVIQACDITFSCVSNPQAAKDVSPQTDEILCFAGANLILVFKIMFDMDVRFTV